MTRLDKVARAFVSLIVQAEPWSGYGSGVSATPEERAAAFQAVIDEAGYFASVAPWEPGTAPSISGQDDVEVLLWFVGMIDTMPRGKLEDEEQHVVNRMVSSKKRRKDEEEMDNTDYETLEEAENEVREVTVERPALWEIIAKLFQSG